MNNPNEYSESIPESQRTNQIQIQNYMIINNEIKNEGYVDSNKLSNNIRLLTMNSKGLNLWNYERIEMFIESIEKL